MAKNKNQQRKATSPAVSVTEKIPLVSVIIPMYNSAYFIPQTLESLLRQTMKDFEVVVVDDCSTDNSVEVVESLAKHFSGRLHLIKLSENNGMPGIPRNVGINFARGKYIVFLDSDDFFTPTALQELTTLAEKFQADVVHPDTFFKLFEKSPKTDAEYLQIKTLSKLLVPENLTICQWQRAPLVKEPTFETPDLLQRIQIWISRGYNWEPFTMFCRRDFLTTNQMYFPPLKNNEDMLFSFKILCLTEKFLRVPNITYIYRQRTESVSKKKFSDPDQHVNKWLYVLRDGINEYEKIMKRIDFFAKHPNYAYAVLNFFFGELYPSLFSQRLQISFFVLNDLIKKKLNSDDAALAAYLFNTVNVQRLQLMRLQTENIALKKSLAQK